MEKNIDQPQPGKVYALTGGPGDKAISNGNTWAESEITPPTPTPQPIRTLECCCCGKRTYGRQWWNRDKGYGLCPDCGDWILSRGEPLDLFERTYGRRGEHWDITYVKVV